MTEALLGRQVSQPKAYDPGLLKAQPRRSDAREACPAPFAGEDRWQLWELSWLGPQGAPQIACALLSIDCGTSAFVESKSLKLYLNSLNQHRFQRPEEVLRTIRQDLTECLRAPVTIAFFDPSHAPLPKGREEAHTQCLSLDDMVSQISDWPRGMSREPGLLRLASQRRVRAAWRSHLFRSLCPVTGQPDWATLEVSYFGAEMDPTGLLRYLVSYRQTPGFHEHCVEQIYGDIMMRCAPEELCVIARFLRRGGIDINPWRATPGHVRPPMLRAARQ